MKVFVDSNDGYLFLKQNILNDEDRERCLNIIFLDPRVSYLFLEDGLYNNKFEFNRAFNEIITDRTLTARLLLKHNDLLSKNQIDKALDRTLEHYDTALLIMEKYPLSRKLRFKALKSITLSLEHTKKFIVSCNPNFCERLYIIQNLNAYSEVLTCYLRNIKIKSIDRDVVFDLLLHSDDAHQCLYNLAICNKLFEQEVKTIYELFNDVYFKSAKNKFDEYYTYCKVFNRLIPTRRIENLKDKLIKNNDYQLIDKALKEIKMPREYKDELQSKLVAKKLV